jgi:hypothetical protein
MKELDLPENPEKRTHVGDKKPLFGPDYRRFSLLCQAKPNSWITLLNS